MENIGFNNDITVGERKFHIQTDAVESEGMAVSKIFLDGQVISVTKNALEESLSADEKTSLVKELHQEIATDMEVLYYINDKVKGVKHAPSANKLGLLFLEKNLYDEAIAQFKLALEVSPDFYEVYSNIGKAYLMNDAYDDSVEILKEGIAKADHFADLQNYIGIAYLYKEEYGSAMTHFEKAIALNPEYIGAHYHLGVAYLAKSLGLDEEEAKPLQEEGSSYLKQASEKMLNRKFARFDEVLQKAESQDFEGAINEFLLSKPKDILTQIRDVENEFYLKFMYGGKGKDDTFISDYIGKLKELVQQNPDYADIHNNLGIAYLIQCRNIFLKSLEEFRAALKINQDFKKAVKNLRLAENDGKGFLILLRAILK